jgi:hypothetical protein
MIQNGKWRQQSWWRTWRINTLVIFRLKQQVLHFTGNEK